MIAVIDSGVGNIVSVERAILAAGGEDVRRVTAAGELEGASRIVFPGQGAFPPAAAWLAERGLDQALRERIAAGTPYLGICLGMQLLFSDSEEGCVGGATTPGLGVLHGHVRRLVASKLPHTGWDRVMRAPPASGAATAQDLGHMYFVHSYGVWPFEACCGEVLVSWHERRAFLAGLRWGRNLVTQFHPEKSGKAGLALIAEWVRL